VSRVLWLVPMLAALSLLASLVPQVTFASASSGQPAGAVLFAWPGWGVQQDLGPLSGTVGAFRIYLSAEPQGDALTMRASLIDANTREVVRAWTIEAAPGYTPVARTLAFPGYSVPADQRLLLQLRVADFEHNYAIFGLASPRSDYDNVMLNGVADSGSGPLALAQMETGSGLRAAMAGLPAERIRLVLAVGFGVLALLVYPRVANALRKAGLHAWRLAQRPLPRARALRESRARSAPDTGGNHVGGILSAPWYPWPVAATPILHFLASNHQVFAAVEALVPLVVSLLVVTASVVILRVVLGDWHRAAAAVTAITIVVFAYGHIDHALNRRFEEPLYFSAATVLLVVTLAAALYTNTALLARCTRFFNLVAVILLALATTGLIAVTVTNQSGNSSSASMAVDDFAASILAGAATAQDNHRPDIYYIIFDEYARADALVDFDNTDFLNALRERGFYIAEQATSNYTTTRQSIPSLLNMSYLADLAAQTPSGSPNLYSLFRSNRVGAILNKLGYTYVHLASGFSYTDNSTIADIIVRFTPSGVRTDSDIANNSPAFTIETLVTGPFTRELVQTTALRPLIGHLLLPRGNAIYPWWHPHRILQMLDFLTNPIDIDDPKFVFAHIGNPHYPPVFDQHGNAVPGTSVYDAFNDDHDPSVPSAYIGQLIYLNSRILEMVDGILQTDGKDSIIIITSDHGLKKDGYRHRILAAFHLPEEGGRELYPSISSVNHFRYVLDYYFGLSLGLLDDVSIPASS